MQLRIWRVTIDGAVAHFDSLDMAAGCVKGYLSKREVTPESVDEPRVSMESVFMEEDEYRRTIEAEDQA